METNMETNVEISLDYHPYSKELFEGKRVVVPISSQRNFARSLICHRVPLIGTLFTNEERF